jgi:excinuclease ABC subunit A
MTPKTPKNVSSLLIDGKEVNGLTHICVQGAREHNLKNIDCAIPRNELVVVTGLSGSGKSSLAFDTIYAEGQRRYVESLSAYARQFLQLMQKPDVDLIEGLSPAISIEQKTTSKNPRSTVGTITEIYDYARLLFARVGVPYSPATGLPIESQSVSQMVDRILAMESGRKVYILAPLVRGRKGEYKKEFELLQKQGYARVKIDGELYEIDSLPTMDKHQKHDIDVVVDRLVVGPDLGHRLTDSVETAVKLSDGLLTVQDAETGDTEIFSQLYACPVSGFTLEEIEPRIFSFNSPFGACPACDGLGTCFDVDAQRVIPNGRKSLNGGAIEPWSHSSSKYYTQTLEGLSRHFKISLDTPFDELPQKAQKAILYGTGTTKIKFSYEDNMRSFATEKPFEGVIPNMIRRLQESESSWVRDELSKYQATQSCTKCQGYRLKPETLCVKIDEKHVGEISNLSIFDAQDWFLSLNDKLSPQNQKIAYRILKEINERLRFLVNVGLGYLSLSRESGTLSGGESQRIRLASQIGAGLTGVLYVLDEPTIGLHQRDNERLLETLKHLRDLGNTVIVVEHDEDVMRAADYLLDIGPGAGVHGGQIVSHGTPAQVMKDPNSLTGQYLSGDKEIPVPKERRKPKFNRFLKLEGANGNNLNNVTVEFPVGCMTCVTGVSGSGKSTLILETFYKALSKKIMRTKDDPAEYKALRGLEFFDKVIDIDQSPIGRTPRSNPATYTGAFTVIRDWYTGLPESKARGYAPGRFSFNVKGGRCENCQGDGVIKIEMHFLPDVYVTCDMCKGQRYNRETLEVMYKGKSIADVLDMTVEEASEFFAAVPGIRDKMETLQKVGLGYLKVGQQATTLSGGEAQRIKLAKELSRKATGRTLYVLDEPTTGLHVHDVSRLLDVLQALVNHGNTIVIIEHNLEVIKTADWLIDMGPDGGNKGGDVVGIGTPEDIVKIKKSHTGHYLKSLLK